MCEYCGRPSDFVERILKSVKRIVYPNDILIHLGDFCIGSDEIWHRKFMIACIGRCWLIRGNHDRKSLGWYLNHGWDCVVDEIALEIFGKRIVLSHKPIVDRDDFDLNIHGHQHNTVHHPEFEETSKRRLLYIEHLYEPISLRRVVERGGCE